MTTDDAIAVLGELKGWLCDSCAEELSSCTGSCRGMDALTEAESALAMLPAVTAERDRLTAGRDADDLTNAVHTAIYTIDYIYQLTAERDRFKAERDAAIKDLFTLKDNPYACYCDICKNLGKDICDRCLASAEIDLPFWEWRGEQNDGRPG